MTAKAFPGQRVSRAITRTRVRDTRLSGVVRLCSLSHADSE